MNYAKLKKNRMKTVYEGTYAICTYVHIYVWMYTYTCVYVYMGKSLAGKIHKMKTWMC